MKKIMLAATPTAIVSVHMPAQAGNADACASAWAARACIGCHGAAGKNPIANYPVIGGKPAEFIATELKKFRSGDRQIPIMAPMAASLSDVDIDNLSACLATQ